MLPSLIGVIASSGGAAAAGTAYESIATVTVGAGGSSSVTFSSIPSTYQHLQIRYINTTSTAYQNLVIRFINVDFPAPVDPTMAIVCPALTSKGIPLITSSSGI